MRFLLDENFPKAVIPALEAMGHEVDDYRLTGVIGSPEADIVRMAKERSAAILTTDRDFFHTLGQEPGYVLEVFNAVGEMVAVVSVRESQVEAPRRDERL